MVRRIPLEQAYPGITFRRRTRNWWARLTRVPAECVHLQTDHAWMATLVPDTLYLRGEPVARRDLQRPEVSLCRPCLAGVLKEELARYGGRIVAFEPDGASFSQYFFIGTADFDAAGLEPEVAAAIAGRLEERPGDCQRCSRRATWLWIGREEVVSLDEVERIRAVPGRRLCAEHGAVALCRAFEGCEEANLFYVNVPYGEAGAYVWI